MNSANSQSSPSQSVTLSSGEALSIRLLGLNDLLKLASEQCRRNKKYSDPNLVVPVSEVVPLKLLEAKLMKEATIIAAGRDGEWFKGLCFEDATMVCFVALEMNRERMQDLVRSMAEANKMTPTKEIKNAENHCYPN